MVTIRIEGIEQPYQMHKGLLAHHSDYFRGAFRDGSAFVEAASGEANIPSDEAEGFEVFARWVYTGRLQERNTKAFSFEQNVKLGKGYIFADMRGIPGLKNDIIDSLIDDYSLTLMIPLAPLVQCYGQLPENDGLCRFIFDLLTKSDLLDGFFNGDLHKFPRELLEKLVSTTLVGSYKRKLRTDDEWIASKCEYHDHTILAAQASVS